jgi:hypothetical protein
MLCSNCKNPIADNSETCEWCATILSKSEKYYKEDRLTDNIDSFKFTPESFFPIIQIPTFIGSFTGEIKVGDSIQINFQNKDYNGVIINLILMEKRTSIKWYQLEYSQKEVEFVTGEGIVAIQIKYSK